MYGENLSILSRVDVIIYITAKIGLFGGEIDTKIDHLSFLFSEWLIKVDSVLTSVLKTILIN